MDPFTGVLIVVLPVRIILSRAISATVVVLGQARTDANLPLSMADRPRRITHYCNPIVILILRILL